MTKAHAALSASIGSPAKKSPHVLKAALKGILSRLTRWHLRRVGKFPEPIKATAERSLHWATDINAWMDDPREWGAETRAGDFVSRPRRGGWLVTCPCCGANEGAEFADIWAGAELSSSARTQ